MIEPAKYTGSLYNVDEVLMRTASWWVVLLVSVWSAVAGAQSITFLPVQSGDDEREGGGGGCADESSFDAGTVSASLQLKIGGETAGCNSEWAASIEFDLTSAPSHAVRSAILVVRKTGYSDDSQGFAYIGSFAYNATGSIVPVEREDLSPDTALSILYPPAANVDLAFDVTPAIQALLASGGRRAGLLLAGVYSEIGYEDWITIGSKSYSIPPRLIVEFERPIDVHSIVWAEFKQLFR
jgi:hypothetical protein